MWYLSLIHISLFGYNICDVAKEVQENVKSSIESMTGLRVVEIKDVYKRQILLRVTIAGAVSAMAHNLF